MQYHIIAEHAEEGGYSGRCLELPGAISEGETTEELTANMIEAISIIQESIAEEAESKHKQIIEVTFWLSLRNHDWREVIKVLAHYGFAPERQRGSHILLKHPDGRRATVPRHDPIKEGTLRSILDELKVSKEEFLKYVWMNIARTNCGKLIHTTIKIH
jgi:predicted RNA binding protein YcfA (HicA-like mRNA interferase family)/predicted RNase H-like HicB family nuclease